MGNKLPKQIKSEINNSWKRVESIMENYNEVAETPAVAGEDYIDLLPDEVLAQIFDFIYASSDSTNVLNLLLVSKRWKELVEFQHIFERSKFFQSRRSNEDYLLALKSQRRYRSFTVNLTHTYVNTDRLRNILQKHEQTFTQVEFNLGQNEKNIFNYYSNPPLINLSQFYSCLTVLQNIEKLTMNFESLYFQEDPADFHRPVLEFSKLKTLRIFWKGGDRAIFKYFLSFIQTPKLEEIHIELPGEYGSTELTDFLKFVNDHSANLKRVYIWAKDIYGFEWSPQLLHIWFNSDMRPGIMHFLENRISDLKEFKVHWTSDQNFIRIIFDEAKNLQHFETSVNINSYCYGRSRPDIKMLTLWSMNPDYEKLARIQRNFPNIETFRFTFCYLNDQTKAHLRTLFPNLKEIRSYDLSTNSYRIVN